MSDDQIVQYCSPTLRDRKAGSLFAAEYRDKPALLKEIAELNARLSGSRIRTMVLGYTRQKALIYMYRPERLEKALKDSIARKILERNGYNPAHTGESLLRLTERLRDYDQFPHEIGLFPGYPSYEVAAFIK